MLLTDNQESLLPTADIVGTKASWMILAVSTGWHMRGSNNLSCDTIASRTPRVLSPSLKLKIHTVCEKVTTLNKEELLRF